MVRPAVAACSLALALLLGALTLGGDASAQGGSCLGQPVTIPGTTGDDVITGTSGNDVIDGLGGNDLIDGLAGDDLICGGTGDDTITGGQGNDRIEGGTENDLLVGDLVEGGEEVGSGDDEAAGGDGADVIVGDTIANGFAGGQGNDKLNGGDDDDLEIGDAYSTTLAVGIGEDEIQGGPGTDITVGDAMVGNPISSIGGQTGRRQGAGEVGAFGSGADEQRTQTGDDVLVGDALNFVSDAGASGAGAPDFLHPAYAYCGTKFTRQIIRRRGAGWQEGRLVDFAKNVLKSEFQDDTLVGNCMSIFGLATGTGPDFLNGGTEDDAVIGGNLGFQAKASKQDSDEGLSGRDEDWFWGDNYTVDFAETSTPSAVEYEGDPPAVDGAADLGGLSLNFFVKDAAQPFFRQTFNVDLILGASAGLTKPRPPRALTGGGDDDLRGGKHDDALEGGPKRDACHGGPGNNKFAKSGPLKCEELTGGGK